MIRINGRTTIGKPDKLFGVSALAKERIAEIGKENVINSTIGVLLDDNGKLVVLSSVMDALHTLEPEDFAAYAPIIGIPEYKQAVTKAIFLDEIPLFTDTATSDIYGLTLPVGLPISCATRSPATAVPETKFLLLTGTGLHITSLLLSSDVKLQLILCSMKIFILMPRPSSSP